MRGLLWVFDTGIVTDELQKAAAAYTRKYGAQPNTALMHPSQVQAVEGLRTKPYKAIIKNSVLIGVETDGI
jgi:hypothetical protein